MGKIRLIQGVARACDHDGFQHLGTFDEAPGTLQGPGALRGATQPPRRDFQHCASVLRDGFRDCFLICSCEKLLLGRWNVVFEIQSL